MPTAVYFTPGLFIFVVMLSVTLGAVPSAILFWRLGQREFLEKRKRKHFYSPLLREKDAVAAVLECIHTTLAELYGARDIHMKDMAKAVKDNDRARIATVSRDIVRSDKVIQEEWARLHEAEATAKFMCYGRLVDEIHAKGMPTAEPAEK